ncbi:MAG TPA: patatin-like phospholipase family protein [Acidobacteriaceae bacterium]|nr:patatin-like phospholipase family protein [Acidobacteriaceae bacterium]
MSDSTGAEAKSEATCMVTETWPQALPYTVIFEELRQRRGVEFTQLVQAWATPGSASVKVPVEEAERRLAEALKDVAVAYANLKWKRWHLRDAARKKYESPAMREAAVETAHQEVEDAAQACADQDAPLKNLLHSCKASALAFSGGGIRSASFSLGVLQRLAQFSVEHGDADHGYLQKLDYLSTVSGGGYTGSWLMSWSRRSSFRSAVEQLGKPAKTAGDPEADPLRHLRSYTSFLAPKYGFSVDTATLAAIVIRNLFLNWVIFLPCLIVLILAPRLLAIAANWLAASVIELPGAADQTLMWVAAGLIAVAGGIAAYRMWEPPVTSAIEKTARLRSETVFMVTTCVAAWLIVDAWLAGWENDPVSYGHIYGWRLLWLVIDLFAASLPLTFVRLKRSHVEPTSTFRTSRNRILWGSVLWSAGAPLTATCATAVALETIAVYVGPRLYGDTDAGNPAFHILAFPVVLSILMLGSGLLSGLLSAVEYEEEREWWARAGGVFLLVMGGWMIAGIVGWYSSFLVTSHYHFTLAWSAGTLVFGWSAAAAGNSASSPVAPKQVDVTQMSGIGRFLLRNQLLAPALSIAALACILLLVGSVTELILERMTAMGSMQALYAAYKSAAPGRTVTIFADPREMCMPILAGVAAIVAGLANYFINLNTFSLHGMYRMRLVRAFLGASNFGRNADRFTNFDPLDNFSEAELGKLRDTPVHVVNTTLNLVDGAKTAWQQRKAESFVFTPFQCGSWRVGYAPSAVYGGLHGVSLGTAMAISGAAFNPNMGYNSSPLVTLVMTLFNARLGWWLPNPGWEKRSTLTEDDQAVYLGKPGPTYSLGSIVLEALGKTNDRRKWVQLSDGGHFENLGLYEMVLRRCHSIVVVDAGADRAFQFEDLGNAVRKINIDLGIPITFSDPWPFSGGKDAGDSYCAIGKIDYCCVDGDAGSPGYLIYIKPRLIGKEPRDVTAYAAGCPAFPHETTVNQFFNEAQFESYRHLGLHEAGAFLGDAKANTQDALLDAALTYCHQERFVTGA